MTTSWLTTMIEILQAGVPTDSIRNMATLTKSNEDTTSVTTKTKIIVTINEHEDRNENTQLAIEADEEEIPIVDTPDEASYAQYDNMLNNVEDK